MLKIPIYTFMSKEKLHSSPSSEEAHRMTDYSELVETHKDHRVHWIFFRIIDSLGRAQFGI